MRIMEATSTLCHVCWRERMIALVWKRELGEPTFAALVCPTCDDVFLDTPV